MKTSYVTKKVLILTIGTGNEKDLENTLYVPLQKSIDAGSWDRVVLLPSKLTKRRADEMERRNSDISVEIHPIPNEGDENDADASYKHFDRIIANIIHSDGIHPKSITLDFTRGTKAMSAALVLAGVAWDIPDLRYIEGERGEGGSVKPDTEKILRVNPEVSTARQHIKFSERLMRSGDFEAVSKLHDEIDLNKDYYWDRLPEQMCSQLMAYETVAEIYAAWDRFDYKEAYDLLKKKKETVSLAGDFSPNQDMEEWLSCLAKCPQRDDGKSKYEERMAKYARYLACDILANTERRFRDGHYEDAIVRWYRVLELIGQTRLFDDGIDSAMLNKKDRKIQQLLCDYKKNYPGENITGKLNRSQSLKFLELIDPSLSKKLSEEGKKQYVKGRNHSLLAHGFTAQSSKLDDKKKTRIVENLFNLLKDLIEEKDIDDHLKIARSINFSKSDAS